MLRKAGVVFCALWGVAIILFPFYKAMPIGLVPVALGAAAGLVISSARQRITQRLMAHGGARFVIGATACALLLRAGGATYFPLEPANDHEMFYRLAASVAAGTGYGWGYGPTAFFPPGMPLLLAAVFAVAGTGPVVAKAVGLLAGTALVPASYAFARGLAPEAVARWTAVLVALSPTLVAYSATVGYEPVLAMVVLAWARLTWSHGARRDGGTGRAAAMGLLCGIGTLIKPICLLLPAISLGVWAAWRAPLARSVAAASVATLLMFAVVLPWTVRNWLALGHPVLVSTNGGVVLYSANHTGSRGIATPVSPLPGEVDEVSRDRVRQRAATEWIGSHPGEFLGLMVPKAVYGWGTTSSIMSFVSYDRLPPRHEDAWKALLNVGWGALYVWCALAAWRTRVWADRRLAPALVFVLYLFAVHLVYEALSRHHVTVLPVLSLTAAAWLASSGPRRASDDSHENGASTSS